jgi:hypothetical protein
MTVDLTRRRAARDAASRPPADAADRAKTRAPAFQDEVRDAVSNVIALLAARHASADRHAHRADDGTRPATDDAARRPRREAP